MKDEFWIVKDNFTSVEAHTYKQVWQGHYTSEQGENLLRANFSDASGCDIYQLNEVKNVEVDGARGKQWSIVNAEKQKDFEFVTVIFPYKGYNNRIDEDPEQPKLKSWKQDQLFFEVEGGSVKSLSHENEDQAYVFGIQKLQFENAELQFSKTTDIYVRKEDSKIRIQLIGDNSTEINFPKGTSITFKNNIQKKPFVVNPGDFFELDLK